MPPGPDLAALLVLADLDTSVAQHAHRLAHLPEAAEVVRLDAEIAAATARRVETAATLAEVAARQAGLEAELASTEARIATVTARLYSGEVTAARDLSAMTADVEALRGRASGLEDGVLEVLDEREPLDGVLGALDGELAALAQRRTEAEEARVGSAATVEQELHADEARRGDVAAELPAPLLADYERIRARAGGAGAARLVGDRCGGCHLTLPAVELDRLRHSPPDAVTHCEECGRILVRA